MADKHSSLSPIIEFKDFSFQYAAQSAPSLKNLNLAIYPGEKVLITGASGCGKSTLVHLINGVIPHRYKGTSTGSLQVCGYEIKSTTVSDYPKLNELSKRVGTVIQDPDGQFLGITVAEDIAFSLENQQIPIPEMHKRVLEAASLVKVEDKLEYSPQDLSGGQKQRVSIAGVMVENQLEILLCDEPLASLDPRSSAHTLELIDQLHEQTNKTVVIVEHRVEDVIHRHVDRVIVMSQGEIVSNTSTVKTLERPILEEYGVRSPLYICALRYANVELEKCQNLDSISELQLPSQEAEKVVRWNESVNASRQDKTQTDPAPLLEVTDLSFTYPSFDSESKPNPVVVDKVSFSVNHGEIISICGNNGAGKSTLAKLLCGFENPTSGSIKLGGEDITSWTIARRAKKIGFVLQNPNQMISKPTVSEEVSLALLAQGENQAECKEKVQHTIRICGLYPMRNWPIFALSYGQKKRVTIASIMVQQPDLLIIDEPTAGQDWAHYTEIMEFIRQLNQQNMAIMLITHDMHLALEYTQRTLVLSGAKVLTYTPCAQVLTDPEICEQAAIKTTSLYELANKVRLPQAADFVNNFLIEDRENRPHNLLSRVQRK